MPSNIRFRVHTNEYYQDVIELNTFEQFDSASDALFALINMMNVLEPMFISDFDPVQIAIQNSQNDLQLRRNDNVIVLLKTQPYDTTDKNYEECSICTDKYEKKEEVSVLDCGHVYHPKCINEWAKYKPTCPVCKAEISIYINQTGAEDID
jgi:hypothetical protein